MTRRGMNYWESKDGKDRRLIFSISDYLQEIDATTGKSIVTFGNDGVVDLREGLGRDPATIGRIQSNTPGKVFENLLILGSATGEAYFSPPGDLRAYDVVTGKLRVAVPHRAASRRVRLRDLAEGRVEIHRRHQHVGRDHDRRGARHRVFPDRVGNVRLLRRRSARRQPVRELPARARRADRQAALALPERSSRSLGLRQHVGAAVDDDQAEREDDPRRGDGGQDRVPLRVQPRDRRADLADRGAAGARRRPTCRASRSGRRSRSPRRRRRSRVRSSRSTTSIRTC